MSEEPRGRRRTDSSGRSFETKKSPAVPPALVSPGNSPEGAYQKFSLPQQHKTPATAGPRRAIEPTRKPSAKDVTKQIWVFSNKTEEWIEITATFIEDRIESWISKETFEKLDLDAIPGTPGDPEWGYLGKRSVPLGGTTELRWIPKGSKRTQETTCRVVDSKNFQIFLQSDLLPSSPVLAMAKPSGIDTRPNQELIPDLPVSPDLGKSVMIDSSSVQEESQYTDTVIEEEQSEEMPGVKPVGSFDGLQETIGDKSEESIRADEWMSLLETGFHKRLGKRPEIGLDRVKIAVLDTGIDKDESSIKGAIRQGRVKVVDSFVPGDPSTSDDFGHGTHVASLLLKVAPHAQVFVLKIAKKEEILSTQSICDAINYAASDIHVDIITMSFGLDKEDAGVQAAILNAYCKNIIMFAAASNNGGNNVVKYPARMDQVICVYATDGTGNPFEKNPTPLNCSSFHFATLGKGVKSSWPRKLQNPPLKQSEPSERRQTGTSFATPIVAGIAACIIEFATVHNLPDNLLRILKTRQGMQNILLKLMVGDNRRSGLHYIHPWEMFTKNRSNELIIQMMTDAL